MLQSRLTFDAMVRSSSAIGARVHNAIFFFTMCDKIGPHASILVFFLMFFPAGSPTSIRYSDLWTNGDNNALYDTWVRRAPHTWFTM